LWNDRFAWDQRLVGMVEVLTHVDADVVAIQEAPTRVTATQTFVSYFRTRMGYPHGLHLPYPDEPDAGERPEGLAFLSRLPFQQVRTSWENAGATGNGWAARVTVEWRGGTLGITNVRLAWQHATSRQQQIVRIVHDLMGASPCDHDVLCGDFNA